MSNKAKIEYWVIPPDQDAEFVAQMEEVLDTYEEPYDEDFPVVCMDEQPIQLTKEIAPPIEPTLTHPKRVDYEYERAGTASIFMFCEALAGWRQAHVRPQRKKTDFAHEVADLLDTRYADCKKITLICDNLNTHTKGAFYEAFPAKKAREYVRRINFCYTPKHGSWLNIAECELSAMTRQALSGRRVAEIETLNQILGAWAADINNRQRGVDWQMKIDDARVKLKQLYPRF